MNKILLVCMLSGITAALFSHPPSDILLEFDPSSKILKVSVNHPVPEPRKHFIYEIHVFLGKKMILTQKFLSQNEKENQQALYLMNDAAPGSDITVQADCNLYGKLKKSIKIPPDEKDPLL